MRTKSAAGKKRAPLNVAMIIPAEEKCGIYTYSQFLLRELGKNSGVTVSAVPNNCGNNIQAYRAFARALEKKYDVIHVQFEFARFGKHLISGTGVPFFYGAFSKKNHVITTLHEIPKSENPIIRMVQNYFVSIILEKSAKVVVHTREVMEKLSHQFPQSSSKLKLIPHGMHVHAQKTPEKTKLPSLLKGKKVVGIFGFISPHKQVEVFLETLSRLPAEFGGVIAGAVQDEHHSEYLASLQQKTRELGLEDRVVWTGFVSEKEMGTVFSWMDFVVFPYKSVTESGALHLAAAHHRVILASRLNAFEEIEQKYHCLSLFSGAEELAQQIQSLAHSPVARKKLLANLKHFSKERDWKAISEQHVALYRDNSNSFSDPQ